MEELLERHLPFDQAALAKAHKEAANKLPIVRNEIARPLASIMLEERPVLEQEEGYRKLMGKATGHTWMRPRRLIKL